MLFYIYGSLNSTIECLQCLPLYIPASNDDSDTVTTLVSSMTTLHTDHLNPFEATKKAKRKKKKKTTTEEDSAPQIVKETSEPCREFSE